ncbi:MAG TPA: class I SAM-dependent methyltransferase [Planctomycetota bacterium]|nr:class I SAM-dependent methyltransferase [Planctomycetota bacterium]
MTSASYPGGELRLFEHARNWKRYWSDFLRPHIRGDAAEIGAGIGANTELLLPRHGSGAWVCAEPDPAQAAELEARMRRRGLLGRCEIIADTIRGLAGRSFDTILYIDVLEHIQDDAAELGRARDLLRSGGRLVVLGPAYPALYSAFDRAIGHHRRYTKESLRGLAPAPLRLRRLAHLDVAGCASSYANVRFLRQGLPTPRQIRLWDRVLVPCSRALDPLLGFGWGRSVVAVWEK